MWVGLKETVRVRVISVRVRDHILPDMLEHQGLPGVLLAQPTAVHLLHRAWCASTGGAIAGWRVHCCRVCVLYSHSSTARICGDTGFSIFFPGYDKYVS